MADPQAHVFVPTGVAVALRRRSMAVMTAGIVGWGHFAEQYAVFAFHARNGGLFSSTNFASWLGSLAVFLIATAFAAQAARSALALRTE
jgi:hypothetical protein